MKVYSDTLTPGALVECALEVNAEFPGCGVYLAAEMVFVGVPADFPLGAASPFASNFPNAANVRVGRVRRIEKVKLRTVAGARYPNSGVAGAQLGEYAASWTEWGWFLARVYERDRLARCGQYRDVNHFHALTGRRFRDTRSPRERQVLRELHRLRIGPAL